MFTKFRHINPLSALMFFFGSTGFIAAFTLTLEKFESLKSPDYTLGCDINPLISCGNVMKSPYAEVFGIPWSLLGVAGYPAVLLLALLLQEKRQLPAWLTWITYLPMIGAFVLSTVFMFLSAYVIKSFCPWCVVSAVSSTSILIALTNIHIQRNNFHLNEKWQTWGKKALRSHLFAWITGIWFILLFCMMYAPFFLARYFEIFIFIY